MDRIASTAAPKSPASYDYSPHASCVCAPAYTRETFTRLDFIGVADAGAHHALEHRRCRCGRTVSAPTAPTMGAL